LLPRLLNVIVGFVVWATNLYHTSKVARPPEQSNGLIVVAVNVDPPILPPVLTQVVAEVRRTELPQRLLAADGSVIQILNVPARSGLV